MKFKIYVLSGAVFLFIQLICVTCFASEQVKLPSEVSDADASTVIDSDSFAKEVDETKKQLDESAPEDAVQSSISPSGRIMNAKQKLDLGHEAAEIVNQAPGDRKKIPAKNPDGTPTVALALGGGGARGAAHIGVLKVFEAEHIPINQIVGNSMGYIVGGLYSAGVSLDQISTCLEDRSFRRAYMPGGIKKKSPLYHLLGWCSHFDPNITLVYGLAKN